MHSMELLGENLERWEWRAFDVLDLARYTEASYEVF
jgi:hypothetical protein